MVLFRDYFCRKNGHCLDLNRNRSYHTGKIGGYNRGAKKKVLLLKKEGVI